MNRLFLKPFRLPFLIRNREQERGTMESDEDKRLQVAAWDLLNSRDDSREARRIQRLAEWRQTVVAIDPRKPEALQRLQRAAAVLWGFERSADDELSTGAMNAVMELSRALKPKVRQVAAGLGFNAADQAALFAVDYSTRQNAWEALEAAAANRAAAVAVEPAAVAGAAPDDQTEVSSKQLAAHAHCTDKQIRDVLRDCPAKKDGAGRKLWRYSDAVGPLRRWSESHKQKRLRVVWPDLALNLKKTKAGTKKK